MEVLGIHFIWTTYGTWLPGDERGHWSALYDLYGSVKGSGHRLNEPDAQTRRVARERMLEGAKVLSEGEIDVLGPMLGRLATKYGRIGGVQNTGVNAGLNLRGTRVMAATIEATHVHLLTGPLVEAVSRYAGRLKGASSAALLRLPENAGRKRIWTTGFWKNYLFDEDAVACVKNYIEEHNERKGLARAPLDWIT